MFKLSSDPQFTHRVSVASPVDGGHETETMSVRYRVVPVAEVAQADLLTEPGTTAFLQRIIVRIDDLVDEHGESLPWSDRVRDQLLTLPHARLAIVSGYFDAVSEARRKN